MKNAKEADQNKANGSANVPAHACCLGMLYYSQSIHDKGRNPVLRAHGPRSAASCLQLGNVELSIVSRCVEVFVANT